MSSLGDLLTHEPGRREFDRRLAQMIRSGEHSAAETVLAGLLSEHPSELSDICLSLAGDAVELSGWEPLAARIQEVSARCGAVTAVGVDLTSQEGGVDASGWRIQALETNYYTDAAFPFSKSRRDEILAQCGRAGAAWQGGFADIDDMLAVSGLNRLNDGLVRAGNAQRAEGATVILAEWFRHLRFHQAAKRGVEAFGTPRAIPLLVGTNEVGPPLEAVYFPGKSVAVDADPRCGPSPDEQRRAEAYAAETEREVEMLRSMRSHLLSDKWKRDPAGLEAALSHARQQEDIHYRHSPAMQQFDYCDLLSDGDFELYLEAYREQREAYRTGSPLPTSRPTPPAGYQPARGAKASGRFRTLLGAIRGRGR